MKKAIGRILSLTFLLAALVTGGASALASSADTASEVFPEDAEILISNKDFTSLGASGMIKNVAPIADYMSASPYTVPDSDGMTFGKAVEIECHTAPESWISSAVKINFDTNSTAYKSIKSGDTLLLKYTARALSGSGDLSVRLWTSPSQEQNLINQKATVKVPSSWQTYYYPMTVSEDTVPNQLIFKTTAEKQKLLIGDLELISYGSKVTKAALCSALSDSGAVLVADKYGICDYYTAEPEYSNENEEDTDLPVGDSTMIISSRSFNDGFYAISMNGNVKNTKAEDSFGLGFTDTVTLSCTRSGGITAFGVACDASDDAIPTKNGDTVILTFYARAKNEVTRLKASIVSKGGAVLSNPKGSSGNKAEYTYFIPTRWTKIVLPTYVSGEVGGIRLYAGEKVSELEIGGVSLEHCLGDTELSELPAGYFDCEPSKRLVLDYTRDNYIGYGEIQKCNDIEICGDYLYAIGSGKLWVISRTSKEILGSVSGMGETRQVAINEDGSVAVVTSRADGAFVIDLSDKSRPVICGRCDTVEYATGVAMANGYCYITNRMFGTEVIDLTDITLPKNIALIRTGEAQSCEIVGTMLFAGCWGERRVEVWDVSNPSEPVLLNKSIPVYGKGDGLCVMGDCLYVSTGHSETHHAGLSLYNVGFGLGNGMDIYDISDIKNPVHLSTVRIDDHFYTSGQDFWTVKAAKYGDRSYAYLVNTFNGVYIYDVTNPKAPIRLAALELTVMKDTAPSKYSSLVNAFGHNGGAKMSYFPYDTYSRQNSPVGGVAIADGKLYAGGVSFGVAEVSSDALGDIIFSENKETGASAPGNPTGNFYEIDLDAIRAKGFATAEYALPGGQIYGVDTKDGLIYAACGNQGIKILDSALETVAEYPARANTVVSEVVVRGDRLYCAEGLGGVAIYSISKDGLTLSELSRYEVTTSSKFIRLSPDGNYVLSDAGSSHSELIDFTDLENPVRWNGKGAVSDGWNPHTGLMYFRQISNGLLADRYLCSYGYAGKTYWYDFGDNPEKSEPVLMFMNPKSGLDMRGGFGALDGKNGKYAIGVTEGTFFVFEPSKLTCDTLLANLPHYSFRNASVPVKGKPSVFGNLMLVTDRIGGICHVVDISELDIDGGVFDASVLTSFNVAGNPDIAKVIGNKILFPLGNQGILAVSLPTLSDNKTVKLGFLSARGEGSAAVDGDKGARITVKDENGGTAAVFYERVGENEGEFTATAYLPKGYYSYSIERLGYLTAKGTFEVTGDGASQEPVLLLPGDIPDREGNTDGKIDFLDILRVLSGIPLKNEACDFNDDGRVNGFDLMLAIRGLGRAY